MRRHLLPLGLVLAGCIEQAPLAGKGEPRRAAAPASPAPPPVVQPSSAPTPIPPPLAPASAAPSAPPASLPPGAQASGAIFGGVIEVLGYRVDPAAATPGQQVAVTTWLKVLAQPTTDDMVFVHVDDSEGRPERVNGDHWPAGHKTPMPQWKVGDVVVDTFSVVLGGFAESRSAIVWMGLWAPDRDERMTITNADRVKTDGNNRLALAEIPILH